MGQLQAGRLKGLAVTTAHRAAVLPELSTMAEGGYPDFIASSWQGMLLPMGAPAAIVARWHAVLGQVLQLPEVRRRFAQAATEAVASASPADFGRFIAREQSRWGALVQRAGATAE